MAPWKNRLMSRRLEVLVIDDHEIIGLGLRKALEDDQSGLTVTSVPTIENATLPDKPSVAVLDLQLSDGSTPSANLTRLHRLGVPVVVYTSGDNPVLVREAIAAGALAVVRKSAPIEDLIEAIHAAAEGRISASVDWAAALDADEDFVSEHLSPTEALVLAHYASGETSEAVARELRMTRNTINTYVARIRDRYRTAGRRADSRVDLFRRAAEDGLVSYFDDNR